MLPPDGSERQYNQTGCPAPSAPSALLSLFRQDGTAALVGEVSPQAFGLLAPLLGCRLPCLAEPLALAAPTLAYFRFF